MRITARPVPSCPVSALCLPPPPPPPIPLKAQGGVPFQPGPWGGAHLLEDAVVPHFVGALIPHDQNLQGEQQQMGQWRAAPALGDGHRDQRTGRSTELGPRAFLVTWGGTQPAGSKWADPSLSGPALTASGETREAVPGTWLTLGPFLTHTEQREASSIRRPYDS